MWLIIGYGNPLRGDDGAGPLLAERFAAQLPSQQAKIITSHQLTPELVLEIAAPEIQQVLFIDAVRNLAAPTITPLEPTASSSCGHQMSPQLLLQLAAKLYQQPTPGWLLTVPGEQFDYSEQLGESAEKNLACAYEQGLALVRPECDQGA